MADQPKAPERTKTVTLGGKEYVIQQLPMRRNREWRALAGDEVEKLAGLVEKVTGGGLQLNSYADMVTLAWEARGILLNAIDDLLELCFAFSPVLAADRERIESEAFEDEGLAILGVIAKWAYPLPEALMIFGLAEMRTSTNSVSRNGDSGTQKRTADLPVSTMSS